jgi:hypothetical protein
MTVGGLSATPAGASNRRTQAFKPAKHTRFANLLPHKYVGKPLRVVTIVQDDGNPSDPTTFDNRMIYFGRALVRSTWYTDLSPAYQLGAQGQSLHIRVSDMPIVDGTLTLDALELDIRVWMAAVGTWASPRPPSTERSSPCTFPASLGLGSAVPSAATEPTVPCTRRVP